MASISFSYKALYPDNCFASTLRTLDHPPHCWHLEVTGLGGLLAPCSTISPKPFGDLMTKWSPFYSFRLFKFPNLWHQLSGSLQIAETSLGLFLNEFHLLSSRYKGFTFPIVTAVQAQKVLGKKLRISLFSCLLAPIRFFLGFV